MESLEGQPMLTALSIEKSGSLLAKAHSRFGTILIRFDVRSTGAS
jgi:hypothetical protein